MIMGAKQTAMCSMSHCLRVTYTLTISGSHWKTNKTNKQQVLLKGREAQRTRGVPGQKLYFGICLCSISQTLNDDE